MFHPWGDSLDKGMATHSSILPGESHGQRSLAGYSLWDPTEWDMIEETEHSTYTSVFRCIAKTPKRK